MKAPSIVLGSAHCISAVGEGIEQSFARMRNGGTASALRDGIGTRPATLGMIAEELLPSGPHRIHRLLDRCLTPVLDQLKPLPHERWACVLATTKGDVAALVNGDPLASALPLVAEHVRVRCGFKEAPITISLACASGTAAIITACSAIERGHFDHAIVIGADVLSRFVVDGFAALFALDAEPCKPFDAQRAGINLGEACAIVVVSRDPSRVPDPLGTWLGGAIAHDANHISGPSRTGEGLMRAVNGAMRMAEAAPIDIGAINAHATGTDYNDAMESIAYERCGLSAIPVSGYKGWFGHTLGAAGVLETVLALRALNEGLVLRTEGLGTAGVPGKVNVIDTDTPARSNVLLKTSSGFGGINAALLLQANQR